MSSESQLYTRQQLEHLEHLVSTNDNLESVLNEITQRLTNTNDLSRNTDPFTLAYLNYLAAKGFMFHGSPYKATPFLQAAESYAKHIKDRTLSLKIKQMSVDPMVSWQDKKDVKATIWELIQTSDPTSPQHLNALDDLVGHYLDEQNYAEALTYAYDFLKKAIACDRLHAQYFAYVKLGFIYAAVNELHLAQYYRERAYEISVKLPQRRYVIAAMGNIAVNCIYLGNLEEAARLKREIIKEVSKGKDQNSYLSVCYTNLSHIYLLKGNTDRAKHYYQFAVKYADTNNPENSYRLAVHLAEIQIASSEHNAAIESLQEAREIGDTHHINHFHEHIWKLLSLTYEQLGEASQALAAYKEYTRLTNQDHKEILSAHKLMSKLQAEFKTAQESFKQEYEHIAYLQETVSEQELAIADLSMKLSLKEKVLHDFWHDLWKESPHLASHYAELLKSSQLNEESKQHFSQPNERRRLANKFTQSLASLHPTLTPTELQVLVCARMGLSSLETASIMKTSDRTVEHHRRNARKKMALPRSMSLQTYLTSIDSDRS